MNEHTPRPSRRLLRWWIAISAGIALVAVVAVVVFLLAFRDTTTPLTPEDVLATSETTSPAEVEAPAPTSSTEAEAPAPTATSVPEPTAPGAPGLYVYATEGFEEIDALTGARHDYPPETFITLGAGGCGIIVRWDALDERWSEQDLCEGSDGLTLSALSSYHEFFGQPDLQEYACTEPGPVLPADPDRPAWSFECSTGEKTESYSGEIVGLEALTIGGEEVEALHVRVVTTLSGTTTGRGQTDTWWLPGTALVLQETAQRQSTTGSPIGDVNYEEQYELRLTSLLPSG
ncbi:MAG: hypothetical protein ACE5KX_06685 [Acidimicrobiia bacterium]